MEDDVWYKLPEGTQIRVKGSVQDAAVMTFVDHDRFHPGTCVPDNVLVVVFRCELHLCCQLFPIVRIEDTGLVFPLQQTDFPD